MIRGGGWGRKLPLLSLVFATPAFPFTPAPAPARAPALGIIVFQLPSPLELALGLWLATFAKFGIFGSPMGGLGTGGGGDARG